MTKILLDSSNPIETSAAHRLLLSRGLPGLSGQTTNPTSLRKYLETSETIWKKKLTHEDVLEAYKATAKSIASHLHGPLSLQVIESGETTVASMISQARNYLSWIPSAMVKFPCTKTGLAAAEVICREGPVNITMVASQEQAAASYVATKNRGYDRYGKPFDVYVSPYVGKLEDTGIDGMDLVANILAMYRALGDSHVSVLAAGIRNTKQIMYCQKLGCDLLTAPLHVLDMWCEDGSPMPGEDFIYDIPGLTELPYHEVSLEDSWESYNLDHDVTANGLAKFYGDWQEIMAAH